MYLDPTRLRAFVEHATDVAFPPARAGEDDTAESARGGAERDGRERSPGDRVRPDGRGDGRA